jgi:peptide deformylase
MSNKYSPLSLKIFPNPVLREKAAALNNFEGIKILYEEMLNIMYHNHGIGLAANQAGLAIRAFVMDLTEDKTDPKLFINPEIIESSLEKQTMEEGCLSLPGIAAKITRPKTILVKYIDENENEIQQEFSDLASTCIQHEIDHLDGILFPDRVIMPKQATLWKKYYAYIKDRTRK